jgi:hypothetical protein
VRSSSADRHILREPGRRGQTEARRSRLYDLDQVRGVMNVQGFVGTADHAPSSPEPGPSEPKSRSQSLGPSFRVGTSGVVRTEVSRCLAPALPVAVGASCQLMPCSGSRGEKLTYDERLAEILTRYDRDSIVGRAMLRAEPAIRAAIDRTQQRLAGPA